MSKSSTKYFLRKHFWNFHSLNWDEYLDPSGYNKEIFEIINFVEKNKSVDSPSVLDIGCATGNYSILFGQKNYQVTGIDFARMMLRKAKKKARANNLSNVKFELTDFNKGLKFADKSFEFAIAAHICQGSNDNPKVFSYVNRVLKGGGYLIMVTKKKRFNKNPHKKNTRKIATFLINTLKPFFFPGYKKALFDIDKLISVIEPAGFKLTRKSETTSNHLLYFSNKAVFSDSPIIK